METWFYYLFADIVFSSFDLPFLFFYNRSIFIIWILEVFKMFFALCFYPWWVRLYIFIVRYTEKLFEWFFHKDFLNSQKSFTNFSSLNVACCLEESHLWVPCFRLSDMPSNQFNESLSKTSLVPLELNYTAVFYAMHRLSYFCRRLKERYF